MKKSVVFQKRHLRVERYFIEKIHWETWYLVRAMLFLATKTNALNMAASSRQMYSHAYVAFATKAPKAPKAPKPKGSKNQRFWLKAKILLGSNNHGTVKKKTRDTSSLQSRHVLYQKGFRSFLLIGKSWDISAENLGIWPGPLKPWAWRRDSKCTARCHCPRFWQALTNIGQLMWDMFSWWLPFFCCHVLPGDTPWKINMVHLQITHLERKIIFQTFMIMLHFNLQGCIFKCRVNIGFSLVAGYSRSDLFHPFVETFGLQNTLSSIVVNMLNKTTM